MRIEDWVDTDKLPTWVKAVLLPGLTVFIIVQLVLGIYWGLEPDTIDVDRETAEYASAHQHKAVTGYATTFVTIRMMEVLLNKPGGYQSNDVFPPTVFMDNIPNWEFGVVMQLRDITRAMRNDFARSQSQSVEDADLTVADPRISFSNDSWILPATETQYRDALLAMESYMNRLADSGEQNAQFFARADNLHDWLSVVNKRLGSLSQRLRASIGQCRINTDLAGDAEARQSTGTADELCVQSTWFELDDIFYEARGTSWALLHLFRAIEIDFGPVLQKKNAIPSLQQIIRELEATQQTIWSPVILNGGGFGIFANHSLVMGNYIARANAAIIDLQNLLADG